ncbi:MAG TPA: copper resistance protein CopC [Pyrinomonadaceae bacterium]|jgi:P pilus assembly chaperone PapD
MLKKISTLLFALLALAFAAPHALAQNDDGIALGPARFELEMAPGSETTVVVNLDYHTSRANAQPFRLVASLNDWDINEKGELGFYKAGTRPGSATPWIIYSPAEVTAQPGQTHSIRVTISVPKDAAPGDHLAALVVEQRPDTIKLNGNARQMVMRFRMASMFYIAVAGGTRRGTLANLQASADARGIVVTPTLRSEGNRAVRPVSSLKVVDAGGRTVAELPEGESLPVLAGKTLSQPLLVEHALAPGTYTVKYRVDFQDGGKVTEGITDLTVKENTAHTQAAPSSGQ